MKTRAGWADLINAELLWTQSMAEAAQVTLQTKIIQDDPRIDFALHQRMPSLLRQWMRRMRHRALDIAKHTCDVCGVMTEEKGESPVRCSEHKESEERIVDIDIDYFANCKWPHHEIAEMAITNPQLAMLGDYLVASDLLTFSDELLCAAYAFLGCVGWSGPAQEHILAIVLEARDLSPDTKLIPREELELVLGSKEVVQRIIQSPSLMAAVRIWARHGFVHPQLKSSAGNAIAAVDSFNAYQAIEKVAGHMFRPQFTS